MTPLPNRPQYSIFLLGDAGEIQEATLHNLALLQAHLVQASQTSTFIMLGDNIYPNGLPPLPHPKRTEAELKLKMQLALTKNFLGNTVVLPGNHDWDQAGIEGRERVMRQEAFVQGYLQNDQAFQPKQGLPGPSELALNDDLTLIVLDFQWFLHLWNKSGVHNLPEERAMTEQVLHNLDRLIEKNRNKRVIFASHHPMYTYGTHGKPTTWKNFIFPLKNRRGKRLWLPLPGFSYLFPYCKRFKVSTQDLVHPRYHLLKEKIVKIIQKHPSIIHVAGHDHSLQHIYRDGVDYIISGSGSKTTAVYPGNYARFACSQNGFARLDFYSNQEVWLEFWGVSEANYEGERLYKQRLFTPKPQPTPQPEPITSM